jgi:hypothetical protein
MIEQAVAAAAAGDVALSECMRDIEIELIDRALDADDAALMELIINADVPSSRRAAELPAPAAVAVAAAAPGATVAGCLSAGHTIITAPGANRRTPSATCTSHQPAAAPTPPASFVTLFQRAVLANKAAVTKLLLSVGFNVRALVREAGDTTATAALKPGGEASGTAAAAGTATTGGFFEQSGRTLLQAALEAGASDTARLLLEAGVPIQGADQSGWTCLHSAAYAGQAECTRLIINACSGANLHDDTDGGSGGGPNGSGLLDARDAYGWTALDLAAFYHHDKVVALLKRATMPRQAGEERYAWQQPALGSGRAGLPQSSLAYSVRSPRVLPPQDSVTELS